MLSTLLILFVLLLAIIYLPISTYNKFKKEHLKTKEAQSNISVYLQKRYEEIAKLHKIAKEFQAHEESLFKEITSLREGLIQNQTGEFELTGDHDKIGGKIPSLLARLEAYPELKSQANFIEVQKGIKNNEVNIAASRRNFNSYVNRYNTSIAMFPSSILANIFKFEKEKLFEVSNENYEANPLD